MDRFFLGGEATMMDRCFVGVTIMDRCFEGQSIHFTGTFPLLFQFG